MSWFCRDLRRSSCRRFSWPPWPPQCKLMQSVTHSMRGVGHHIGHQRAPQRAPFLAGIVVVPCFLDPLRPSPFEVQPHHLVRLPFRAPGHLARYWKQQIVRPQVRLRRQPLFQQADHLRMQDLGVLPSAFAVAGRHRSRGRVVVEPERPWRRAADLTFPESGPPREDVHDRAVRTGDHLDMWTGLCGLDQQAKFLGRQDSAVVAAIGTHVQF